MAYDYAFLNSAKLELADITAYLDAVTASSSLAARFLEEIEQKIDLICSNPRIFGLSRMPELAERGYHAAFIGNYVVLYTFSEDTVFIGHISHQRQDYSHLV